MNLRIERVDNKILVYSPYSKEFIKAMKNLGGRWKPASKCWQLDYDLRDVVRTNMLTIFGMDDLPTKLVDVEVTCLDTLDSPACSGIVLFGREIVHAFGRDSGAVTDEGVSIISGTINSNGSMKNWGCYIESGSIVLVRDVPVAALKLYDNKRYHIKTKIIEKHETDKKKLKEEKEKLLKRISEIDNILNN